MDGQQTQPQTWQQGQWDRSAGIRHAALAAGVERIQKASRLNRRLVKKLQDGTLGKETTEPEDEEDDSVHVGDIWVTNTMPVPQPVASQPTTPLTPLESTQTGLSKTAAAVLIAASLLGGAGTGAALYAWLKPTATMTDTDTRYQLRFAE